MMRSQLWTMITLVNLFFVGTHRCALVYIYSSSLSDQLIIIVIIVVQCGDLCRDVYTQ